MITKAECQPSTLTTSQVNEEAVDAKKQGKEEEKTIMNSSEDECESGRMSVSSVVQASDTSTSAARRVEKVQDSPKEHFFIRYGIIRADGCSIAQGCLSSMKLCVVRLISNASLT